MRISPIFDWELAAIARRPHLYVFRWCYGLALFVLVCFPMYTERSVASSREMANRELVALNEYFLGSVVIVQGLAVLILVPALVGPALAEEKQRRGLDILLTTSLSSAEIVVGKLGARMCHLTVVLLLTIPVFCLLSMNGGIDVGLVVLSYLVTFTSALLIAAAAILISTVADRPLAAVTTVYVVVAGWLFFPFLPNPFPMVAKRAPVWDWLGSAMRWGQDAVGAINPLYALPAAGLDFSSELVVGLGWVMLAQVGVAALLALAAALLLRPVARRAGAARSRFRMIAFLRGRRSLLPRRGCGDWPILWKECALARSTVLMRLVATLVFLAIAVPAAVQVGVVAVRAFHELSTQGWGATGTHAVRNELNWILRSIVVALYMISVLAVAARAAVSFTSEMEKDTWTSLIATPLERHEIVLGKVAGALWAARWLVVVYLAAVVLGVATTAVHPLAALMVVLEMVVYLAFVALLGTAVSMRLKSSVRALAFTALALLIINGGFLGCCMFAPASAAVVFLITPIVQGASLATYLEIENNPFASFQPYSQVGVGWWIVLSVFFYGVCDLGLGRLCLALFDSVADRPKH